MQLIPETHALHPPLRQTRPGPQLEPSGTFVPVSVHIELPVEQSVA
jgi:hypothetical protein